MSSVDRVAYMDNARTAQITEQIMREKELQRKYFKVGSTQQSAHRAQSAVTMQVLILLLLAPRGTARSKKRRGELCQRRQRLHPHVRPSWRAWASQSTCKPCAQIRSLP